MSIIYINQFYLKIYNLLLEDAKIKQNITCIYLNVAKDANYPFLLINILQIEDLTNFELYTYSVKFEISLFTRDKNILLLTEIAAYTKALLKSGICSLDNYQVLCINARHINFEQGQDLLSLKMTMNFEALLQKADQK